MNIPDVEPSVQIYLSLTRQGEANPCAGIGFRVNPDATPVGFHDGAGQI